MNADQRISILLFESEITGSITNIFSSAVIVGDYNENLPIFECNDFS